MNTANDIQTADAPPRCAPSGGSDASCIRCGEKLKGVMALTATLCGLCGDDELNERAREERLYAEVFDPKVSDLEYFQARKKYHDDAKHHNGPDEQRGTEI